jgi:hypothetical protein
MSNRSPRGRELALILTFLSCTCVVAHAADKPPGPHAAQNPPVRKDAATAPHASTQSARSPDRPPPESGRPAIGPRTTQGLAADAIARSNAP